MRFRWSLRVVLPALAVALVLAVAALVDGLAVRLLHRASDENGLARVRAAGLAAARAVAQEGDDVGIATRLLAERPTLRRLAEGRDVDALKPFLAQFVSTGGLDGCAVAVGGGVVTGGDPSLPWGVLVEGLPSATTGWDLRGTGEGRPLVLLAVEEIAGPPLGRIVCARRLDDRRLSAISERIGLPATVVDRETARGSAADAVARLRGAAVEDGRSGASRIDAVEAFVDVEPLRDRADRVLAALETRLDAAEADRSIRELVATLRLGAAITAVVAALVALVLARSVTSPLAALAEASSRIGGGDLDTPLPRVSGREVSQLADRMDEMRARLARLTAELTRRHAEATAILTGIVEGVWAVDRERRITWMNPQAADALGVPVEGAVGRFCGDVLHPVLPDGGRPCETSCPIVDARFRGSARATEHLALPDGTRRTVVITSALTVAEAEGDDRVSRQFQVLRDETQTEAAGRMRDAVLANVSHEFRTPLSAQLASLELLRERLEDLRDPEAMTLVASMERGALRLVHLVDNLLESVRIDAGRDSIRKRPVRVDALLDEAIDQIAPLAAQKGQTTDASGLAETPEVSGDGPRLVQVFTNLLANAVKFAPAGSTIRVGDAVGATEIAVWVEDEGPGLPDDDGRLFQRFHRAESEEPEERGVGLGLFIAHAIVVRHGGRLEARNTGRGARVTVTLPREEAP